MKKILSLILVLILCTSLMALTVSAAGSGSLSASVDNAKVAAGETVTVTVKLNSNSGIAYLKLTPSSTATRTSFTGSGLPWTIGSSAVFYDITNNTYTGSILTLTYTAPDAPGTYSVNFTVQAWDENEEAVSFNAPSTSFEVVCDHNYVKDDAASSDPTCGKDGKLVEVCSKCGDTKETTIPATGKHNYVKDDATSSDATCGKDGKLVEKCSACGDTKETTIPATGKHNYVKDDAASTDATCGKDGKLVEKCSVCGDTKETTIPATGKHTYTYTDLKDGKNHKVECSVCGHEDTEGHTWGPWKTTVEPDEANKKDGEKQRECEYCDAHETKKIPWDLDDVSDTGDITSQVVMTGAVVLVVMMGAVALVFKRKIAK